MEWKKPKKLPVFIGCFGILFPKEFKITKDVLIRLTTLIFQAAKLQPLEEMIVRSLESPVEEYPAFCTVQPLKTSMISVTAADAWPELQSVVAVLHSCQEFSNEEVCQKILQEYLGVKIVQNTYDDRSFNVE